MTESEVVSFFDKPAKLLFLLLLFLCGCNRIKNNEIRKSWWLYGEGYNIGDVLQFDDASLKGDTIYMKGRPVALIVDCSKEFYRNSAVLEIESLNTHEIGTYHDKGPR